MEGGGGTKRASLGLSTSPTFPSEAGLPARPGGGRGRARAGPPRVAAAAAMSGVGGAAYVGAAAALALALAMSAALAWRWGGRRRRLQQVGSVAALFLYPVKSCGGSAVRRAELTALGLRSGDLRDR